MSVKTKKVLECYNAWEPRIDKCDFQWKLRLLQAHWSKQNNFPTMVEENGKVRGAELDLSYAEEKLANFLTPTIRRFIRREVLDPTKGKRFRRDKERILKNLLSSQPMSFNLFGEMAENHGLASSVLGAMTKGRLEQVLEIEFEWFPPKEGSLRTQDGTAFDVYIRYANAYGNEGFLGIELKYHEVPKDEHYYLKHGQYYDKIAASMGCFKQSGLEILRKKSHLDQLWRNHLLAGIQGNSDGIQDFCSVTIYPKVNCAYESAVNSYGECLTNFDTFNSWTLDDFLDCTKAHTTAPWVDAFFDRYLNLDRLPL